jgi:hypothetical protein
MKSLRACTTTGRLPMSAAPIATPVSACSAMGTSNTRAAPKRSNAERVVPKMPLWSSTPIPHTKTLGSRSMPCTRASAIASA